MIGFCKNFRSISSLKYCYRLHTMKKLVNKAYVRVDTGRFLSLIKEMKHKLACIQLYVRERQNFRIDLF